MEDIPPSYDEINTSVLDILPAYIDTATLVNLCLVSKLYYNVFIPHLWGSPASHFVPVANQSSRTNNGINFADLRVSGTHNDMVYVALTRFKRILRRARLSTRMLCHTLHLPAALSEIYGGPNSTWLREVLDWLPALQSLCVSGLPFFDHDSLVAVDQSRGSSTPSDPNNEDFRRYPVKLLLAAKEPNVTWVGLSLLIPHLPHLVYLDLSYTSPARNVNVLRSLDALTHLQVLKLRGLGLKDNELEVLANTIKLRVRLLDIAENQLSDMAVRSLMQACVWLPSTESINGRTPNDMYSRRHLESWPVGLPPPPDSLSLDTIRTLELDEGLLTQLTNPLTGRLAFEDIPHGGITHLFISGNPGVTIESVRSMLDIGRLHVLDAGDIAALTPLDLQIIAARYSGADRDALRARGISTAGKNLKGFIHRHRSRPSSLHSAESGPSDEYELDEEDFRLPGAEKLVPVLKEKASKNLTHLRINHTVATAVLDIAKDLVEKNTSIQNLVELPGVESRGAELDAVNREVFEAAGSMRQATEMTTDTAIFELDATPAMPRVELPGDIIHFAVSPPIGDAPHEIIEEVLSPIRGEGAMAPEVAVREEKIQAEFPEVRDPAGQGLVRSVTSATDSTVSSLQSTNSANSASVTTAVGRPAPLKIRKSTNTNNISHALPRPSILNHAEIGKLEKLRPALPIKKLHPSFLPHLRTLILTNLPAQVPSSSNVVDNLKSFVTACAAEERLAILKARTDYSLPPGRARLDAEREHARTSFALRAIVLEIDPDPDRGSQRRWQRTSKRIDISKSSTGDPDSEALWSAADNDFSFFGEEGEEPAECGIYENEPDLHYRTTIPFDEKIVVSSRGSFDESTPQSGISSPGGSLLSSNPFSGQSSLARNATTMRSPRNLPLGRNRRVSNETYRGPASPNGMEPRSVPRNGFGPSLTELPASTPALRSPAPTSNPTPAAVVEQVKMLDVVAELASWRRERKAAYEAQVLERRRRPSMVVQSLADLNVYVEGYWSGEVKVIRNPKKNVPKGKNERQGNIDVYGNYHEGYLYP